MIDRLKPKFHGQEDAVRSLSTAVYSHFLSLAYRAKEDLSHSPFGNRHAILIGPTGTGKSFLATLLASELGAPYIFANAASLTESGYVGLSIEDMLYRLAVNSGYNLDRIHRSIVLLDEFDKLAAERSKDTDVGGLGVQQELLMILDGRKITVEPKRSSGREPIEIDTSKILFIATGAFSGIDKIVSARLGKGIGFRGTSNDASCSPQITNDDLIEYGFLPELIGRFAVHANFKEHTADDLTQIMALENSVLQRHRLFFELHGVELVFDDNAIQEIAEQALFEEVGARGLDKAFFDLVEPLTWQLNQLWQDGLERVTYNAECIKNQSSPELSFNEKREEHYPKELIPLLTLPEVQEKIEDVGDSEKVEGKEDPEKMEAQSLKELKRAIGFEDLTKTEREWWQNFEDHNENKGSLIRRLYQSLHKDRISAKTFFYSYLYSLSNRVETNIALAKYLSLLSSSERAQHKKTDARARALSRFAKEIVRNEAVSRFLSSDEFSEASHLFRLIRLYELHEDNGLQFAANNLSHLWDALDGLIDSKLLSCIARIKLPYETAKKLEELLRGTEALELIEKFELKELSNNEVGEIIIEHASKMGKVLDESHTEEIGKVFRNWILTDAL